MVSRLTLATGLASTLLVGGDLKALKTRGDAPQASDLDSAATLKALLSAKRTKDHDSTKGAVLEGHVLKVEQEGDGDCVLILGTGPHAKLMQRIFLEVPPAWQSRNPRLSPAALRQAEGHKVRATGWLLYDTASDDKDPRGSLWELHPLTDLEVLD
jgi:hypothetical protein